MSRFLTKFRPLINRPCRKLSSAKSPVNTQNFTTAAPKPNLSPQKVLQLLNFDEVDQSPKMPEGYEKPQFSQRILNSCKTSLREPIPDFPVAKFTEVSSINQANHRLTTLPSGIRVVTEPQFGEFCTIGVLVNAGSRHEVAYPSGIIHFLEKLAFNSTKHFKDPTEISSLLEKWGGMVDAQGSKDTFIYASSCHHSGAPEIMQLIADAMFRSNFTNEEMDIARNMVSFDIEDLGRSQDPQPVLHDFIHAAAYKDNTLGLPKLCPLENLSQITPAVLYSFMKSYFIPERLVVAGVGVDHDILVESTKKYFEEEKPVWESNSGILLPNIPKVDHSSSQFTGGCVLMERDLSDVSFGPNPLDEFAHFVLGLESCNYLDSDFVPFCVLSSLMGGGNSFSAGGPGKGMYTRLYTHVLNRHHYMNCARAENFVYRDSGLFTIHSSAAPDKLCDIVSVVVQQFLKLSEKPSDEEVSRAKKQLQSLLLMQLELRPVVFEDTGKQILSTAPRKTPMQYVEEIEKVTAKDLVRIGERLLESKPAVVGYGKLGNMPEYSLIQKAIATRDISVLPKSSFFRNMFNRG